MLADLQENPQSVDQHWRPQHRDCPFCLLNFTIYSKMEELDQDSLFFMKHSNLSSKLDYKKKLNPIKTKSDSKQEKKFWSLVDRELILQLEEPWAYLADFHMFGYSVRGYLKGLGLGHRIGRM